MSDTKRARRDRIDTLSAEAANLHDRLKTQKWSQQQIQLALADLNEALLFEADAASNPTRGLMADFAINNAESRIRQIQKIIESYGDNFEEIV